MKNQEILLKIVNRQSVWHPGAVPRAVPVENLAAFFQFIEIS
jgi:hypothetical protein